jgi:hypothetical protein
MVAVKPGDTVVYQLKFADWSADLERPDNKNARIALKVLTGEPLNLKVLPYAPGSQLQEVRISGGGKKRGDYQVTRTVKSNEEVRVRSFSLKVMP